MKWGRTLEVSSVTKRLKAKCFTQLFTNQLEHPIEYAFACDLMSDVLTFVNQEILLITGLSQLQSLRTTEMLDIKYILFVRGKQPSAVMLDLAVRNHMILLGTNYMMYEAYQVGLTRLEV